LAIYRSLQKSAFAPEDINLMVTAYELALVRLAIKDRNDPLTEIIAKHTIEVAQTGEKERHQDDLRACAVAIERHRPRGFLARFTFNPQTGRCGLAAVADEGFA
jgi:hypothetical protein